MRRLIWLTVGLLLAALFFSAALSPAEGDGPCGGAEVCVADTIPNDPMFAQMQWGPKKVHAPAAWDLTTGSADIVIAVVDTGVDCGHPDLAGKCVPGYDIYNNDADPFDDHGHGTFVAGIAAAVTNNGVGVAGTCWQCKIMPVKVLSSGGSGFYFDVAAGVRWAADNGADVINMSLGGGRPLEDDQLDVAVSYAHQKGVLVISACGNTGNSSADCLYPASAADSMAVTCTGQTDVICSFSSAGPEADVSAPGSAIVSTVPTGTCALCTPEGYLTAGGTSASTPFVSGVAALVLTQHPEYTPDEVWGLLELASDDVGTAGWDRLYGFGRLNAYDSLTLTPPDGRLVKPVPTATPAPTVTASPTPRPPTPTPSPTPTCDWPSQRWNPSAWKCVGPKK